MWSSAGTLNYVNAVTFELRTPLRTAVFTGPRTARSSHSSTPKSFSGDLDRLNFKVQWGNKGTTNCWSYFIFPECEIVDGSDGIVRGHVLSAAPILSVWKANIVSNVQIVST